MSNWLNNWFTLFDLPAVETVSPQEQLPQHSSHGGMDWSVIIYFFVTIWQTGAKRNHTKRLLAKIYYSPQSKVSISLRLVQNSCRNWAIALGVTPPGPKFAQEP